MREPARSRSWACGYIDELEPELTICLLVELLEDEVVILPRLTRGRGQVMSAYYLTGYLSLAIPAILAGLAATRFGLTHTYLAFGAVAAVTCGAAGWLGGRLAAGRRGPQTGA